MRLVCYCSESEEFYKFTYKILIHLERITKYSEYLIRYNLPCGPCTLYLVKLFKCAAYIVHCSPCTLFTLYNLHFVPCGHCTLRTLYLVHLLPCAPSVTLNLEFDKNGIY